VVGKEKIFYLLELQLEKMLNVHNVLVKKDIDIFIYIKDSHNDKIKNV
jgi:hypothetical protein